MESKIVLEKSIKIFTPLIEYNRLVLTIRIKGLALTSDLIRDSNPRYPR